MFNKNSKGQTLMELIVVVAVGILIVSALTFATISSLRNTQLAQNQAQATKLAQEGMEKVRSIRDRDGAVSATFGISSISKFSGLWSIYVSRDHCTTTDTTDDDPCYFALNSSGTLNRVTEATYESLGGGNFKRQVRISDDSNYYAIQKKITVIVTWTDFSGPHESKLTTILRKL